MLQTVIDVIGTNAGLLELMLADVADERMCEQPAGLPNHPAWQVGHLAVVRAQVTQLLGGAADACPEAWRPLFGSGSTPAADRAAYPSKDELLATFRRANAGVVEALGKATPEALRRTNPIEPFRERFPTVGHLATTLLTTHDGMHLGQLSDWRRVNGLPRVI